MRVRFPVFCLRAVVVVVDIFPHKHTHIVHTHFPSRTTGLYIYIYIAIRSPCLPLPSSAMPRTTPWFCVSFSRANTIHILYTLYIFTSTPTADDTINSRSTYFRCVYNMYVCVYSFIIRRALLLLVFPLREVRVYILCVFKLLGNIYIYTSIYVFVCAHLCDA